jgi:ABC-2 type transport system ATP-binding protein
MPGGAGSTLVLAGVGTAVLGSAVLGGIAADPTEPLAVIAPDTGRLGLTAIGKDAWVGSRVASHAKSGEQAASSCRAAEKRVICRERNNIVRDQRSKAGNAKMIEVRDLCKNYQGKAALSSVSFQVAKGEIVGFLGPNGAGKTTALRILAGFIEKSSGYVSIAGQSLDTDSHLAKAQIGYLPEAVPLYDEMRVAEYLLYRAELKGVPRSERRAEVLRVAKATDVLGRMHATIRTLSKGLKQRVGLADALLFAPSVLLLDEPTSGLDPNQLRQVRELLDGLRENHAILLSTHLLAEAEAVCDRALLLSNGKLAGEYALGKHAKGTADNELRVEFRTQGAALPDGIQQVPGTHSLRSEGDLHSVALDGACAPDDAAAAIATLCASQSVVLLHLAQRRTNLEETFARLTVQK